MTSEDFDDDFEPATFEGAPLTGDLPTVTTPAGATIPLANNSEVRFYERIATQYQDDNGFQNISDLLELDRLLNYEVMCFRWSNWLLRGHDYEGGPIMASLNKDIQLYSKEVRDIKAGLGIDKKTRDKDRGSTTAEFWDNLRLRAGQFGVHRNEQVIKAHTLWKELEGKVTLYKNSTDVERTLFHCHESDIFDWLEEKFVEFDEIDKAFRLEQKIWIREIN